jgi:hypothetical protein
MQLGWLIDKQARTTNSCHLAQGEQAWLMHLQILPLPKESKHSSK